MKNITISKYTIKCKDGVDRRVCDIEKDLGYELFLICAKTKPLDQLIHAGYYYDFSLFCSAFEYIARSNKKDMSIKYKDIVKAKDNLRYIESDNFLLFMLDKLCEITEIGEELEKYTACVRCFYDEYKKEFLVKKRGYR